VLERPRFAGDFELCQMGQFQDPSHEEIQANIYLMDEPEDVPILLVAIKAKVDYP
jgi:hypothetical protein